MRDLWKEKWTRDEELPEQKKEECKTITADLVNATTFVRPRHIPITEKNCVVIYVDSSFSAYAAVVYFNGELYMAKTSIPKTIPELESMTMVLGSQLGKFLQQTLQHLPMVVETLYWSDSEVKLPGLAQINQDTENVCSQPSEHDQQLQM